MCSLITGLRPVTRGLAEGLELKQMAARVGRDPSVISREVGRHGGRRWNLRKEPAVRPAEPQRAAGISIDLKAVLVDGAMVPPTEQREVRERGRAALRPMTDVMTLAETHAAPGEPAAPVPMLERPP